MKRLEFLFLLVSQLAVLCSCYRNQYDMDYLYRFTGVYFSPHKYIIGNYITNRKNWETSNLGSILFKNQEIPKKNANKNKKFVILIWKYWYHLKNRHIYNFGINRVDPLEKCSVKNCKFVGSDNFLATADTVVVHLHYGVKPIVRNRNPYQIWVFLTDESPLNTFDLSPVPVELSSFANVFNWSMTYRSDSDVPVPYGRTLPRRTPVLKNFQYKDVAKLVPMWNKKRRNVLASILISNCEKNKRMVFIRELKKHIPIDVYGKCSDSSEYKLSCPGRFKEDCELMSEYLFYLVLENSNCSEYISEKSFHHAYSKGVIPVIRGPSLSDCQKLLPPNSYLHVDNFATTKHLAKFMMKIANNEAILLSYHFWRNNFEVLSEHGYFGTRSYHLCRLCEAMNYNDRKVNVYSEDDLKTFLDPNNLCSQP